MARNFKREKNTKNPQPRILVICEDSKSSLNYLEEASQRYRSNATIRVIHMGKTNPYGIVEYAVKEKNNYEKIYCVIDRDEHDRWDDAQILAQQNYIEIIASYPCYEYWLFLHHRYSRKSYSREGNKSPADCMCSDLRNIPDFTEYKKGQNKGLFFKLENQLATAKRNAIRGLREVENDPTSSNPSTRIHLLLEAFEAIGSNT